METAKLCCCWQVRGEEWGRGEGDLQSPIAYVWVGVEEEGGGWVCF